MNYIELENEFKTKVILSTVGASIVDIKTLDYMGNLGSIVTVPINQKEFENATSYFGKTIGRTGGRISNSKYGSLIQ